MDTSGSSDDLTNNILITKQFANHEMKNYLRKIFVSRKLLVTSLAMRLPFYIVPCGYPSEVTQCRGPQHKLINQSCQHAKSLMSFSCLVHGQSKVPL